MNKVIFCGFGKLGTSCLQILKESGYEIKLILTHKELLSHSVDTFAEKHHIIYKYYDARKEGGSLLDQFKEEKIQYLISVNYRYILPIQMISFVKYAINIHGSLLPKYRGRTPHVWSIINGEKIGGITCHLIEETVDTGAIIVQKTVDITPDDTGYTLLEKFQTLYPEILLQSLTHLKLLKPLITQDENMASYYGKRTPDMGYIDFNKGAQDIINFIRAQAAPYPGAYTYLISGKKIIINKIKVNLTMQLSSEIGRVISLNQLYYVRCKDALLEILEYRICE